MKIDRQSVYDKYNGRCAYCGLELPYEKMQVDHYWPQLLKHLKPDENNNDINNMNPSCRKCNIHKGGLRPEVWRSQLSRQVSMLKDNTQFSRALRFGQIKITESPIVFYFERFNSSVGKRG